MNIAKRVGALENQVGDGGFENVHRITGKLGQTHEQAFDAYGRDKIGPRDFVVVRVFVTPRFDANGNMIFRKKPS